MTLTAQMRRKARAAALAEPYRQRAIDERLERFHREGTTVIIATTQRFAGGAYGKITEYEPGVRVVVAPLSGSGSTSIPRKIIRRVERSD